LAPEVSILTRFSTTLPLPLILVNRLVPFSVQGVVVTSQASNGRTVHWETTNEQLPTAPLTSHFASFGAIGVPTASSEMIAALP